LSFFYFSDEATADDVTMASEVAILTMGGEIDYAASPQLKEQLAGRIRSGVRHLVLDLSDATFIDSTAIGVLVGAAVKLTDTDRGLLLIVATNRNVLQIFELTGLDRMVGLHSSREEALSALALAG
jgi:anti-sigma B factor antagonist